MKKVIAAVVVLGFGSLSSPARTVRPQNLDFKVKDLKITAEEIAYGWDLMPWREWLRRPTSGPLFIPFNHALDNVEIFEAHIAGIVDLPATRLSQPYLHDIETIHLMDPVNRHRQLPDHEFLVETIVPFPKAWSILVELGRNLNLLESDTDDHLRMINAFGYADRREIETPAMARVVKLLDPSGKTPDAINFQGTLKINQLLLFVSSITLFYEMSADQTMVQSHMAIGLKKEILDLGFEAGGVKLTGRHFLFGRSGAGIPQFVAVLYENMLSGLRKETPLYVSDSQATQYSR